MMNQQDDDTPTDANQHYNYSRQVCVILLFSEEG